MASSRREEERSVIVPTVLVITTYQALMWNLYLMPALLAKERFEEEIQIRKYFLRTRLIAILIEIFMPSSSVGFAGTSMLAVALAGPLAAAAGFGLISRRFLAPCTILTRLSQIPAIGLANAYALNTKTSKWTFKALAWIAAEILATCALLPGLRDFLIQPTIVMILCGCPPLTLALLLLRIKQPLNMTTAHSAATENKTALRQRRLTLRASMLFVTIACAFGTVGEALNDMVIDLAVRNALKSGNSNLAIAYNLAVIFAMTAAYFVESRADKLKEVRYRQVFSFFWAGTQLLRSLLMPAIHSNWGAVILATTVLLDKFAGPLGGAALDAALLELLHSPAAKSPSSTLDNRIFRYLGLPVGTLWALRGGFEKAERPVIQLSLLRGATATPPWWLSPLYALVTATAATFLLEYYSVINKKHSTDFAQDTTKTRRKLNAKVS